MMEDWPCGYNWEKLDNYVLNHANKVNPLLFSLISKKPLTNQSIDELIRNGLRLESMKLESYGHLLGGRVIILRESLKGYERDKTVFHEVLHALYGVKVSKDCFGDRIAKENNALVEWAARRFRAQPNLLRHTIKSFGLEIEVYDLASYYAYNHLQQGQLQFPFVNGKLAPYLSIGNLMD
ncbi:MAG: hypothetical protein Q8R00_01430 [Candidatus Nanoarchaeia archaeon]|nr:hypothetical protein [Candidatus Nanoarchaeia archaeon]